MNLRILHALALALLALACSTPHARAYRDLETGTFITRDPAGFVDGPNVYTYVRQNPWSTFDPHGLKSVLYVRDKTEYDRIQKLHKSGDFFYKDSDVRYAPDDKDGKKHFAFSGKLSSVSVGKERYDKGGIIIGTAGAMFFDDAEEHAAYVNYFNNVEGAGKILPGIGAATATGAQLPVNPGAMLAKGAMARSAKGIAAQSNKEVIKAGLQQAAKTPAQAESQIAIQFGKVENQVSHTFRHVEAAGLERSVVQTAVKAHLESAASRVVAGKPFNAIVEVGGKRLQYTAFRLQDGTLNVGRIHPVP